jgi:hypothetical protein
MRVMAASTDESLRGVQKGAPARDVFELQLPQGTLDSISIVIVRQTRDDGSPDRSPQGLVVR